MWSDHTANKCLSWAINPKSICLQSQGSWPACPPASKPPIPERLCMNMGPLPLVIRGMEGVQWGELFQWTFINHLYRHDPRCGRGPQKGQTSFSKAPCSSHLHASSLKAERSGESSECSTVLDEFQEENHPEATVVFNFIPSLLIS